MYRKVIIAEDQDTAHFGLAHILQDSIPVIEKVKYCDDALLKIKASIQERNPFDLLITDLNFNKDYRPHSDKSGEELIIAARTLLPELKVIVFSIEKGVARIKRLYDHYHINAFIEKGRNTSSYVKKALDEIAQGNTYCSPNMHQLLRGASEINELEEKDIMLLDLLTKGLHQKAIAGRFRCSISSIEKRLNRLKTLFNASTSAQLISIAKDWGVI